MRYDLNGSTEGTTTEGVGSVGGEGSGATTRAESFLQKPTAEQIRAWLGLEPQRIVRASIPLIAVGIFALLFVMNFRVVVVEGHSMEPTYHYGQRRSVTSAYWLFGPIRKGDVVVIELPGRAYLIKRVVALGGEEVPRRYWGPSIFSMGTRVPPGKVYVVGDNLERSEDSRQLGAFPIVWVQGKVVGGYREVR